MKSWRTGIILILVLLTATLLAGCSDGKKQKKEKEDSTAETVSQSLPVYTEDGVNYSFRTAGRSFQIYGKDGKWQEHFSIGVNIGAGKPGYFPGEFGVTKEDYLRWFEQISEMHADTIRVYTMLMPDFYQALQPLHCILCRVYTTTKKISAI